MADTSKPAPAEWAQLVQSAAMGNALIQLAYLALVREVIIPLAVFSLLALVVAGMVGRLDRSGAGFAMVVGLVQLGASGNFLFPALGHPESPVDFMHAAITVASILTMLAAAAGVLARVQTSPKAVAATGAVVTALAVGNSMWATFQETSDVADDASVTILATGNAWSPAEITLGPEESIFIENKDMFRHTFRVRGTGVSVEIPAARSRLVPITLGPGDFEFFCDVPGHEDMTGTLVITN